ATRTLRPGNRTLPCPPPPLCARALPLTLIFSVSPWLCGEYGFAYANAQARSNGRAELGAMGSMSSPCPPPSPCARALPLTLFFSVPPCLRGEYCLARGYARWNLCGEMVIS